MRVLPFKKGLASARMLREQGHTILNKGSRPKRGTVVMNWGGRKLPPFSDRVTFINNPLAIPLVADKKNWAHTCDKYDLPSIGFTLHKEEAQRWAARKGDKVICRTVLNGSNGEGIVIARNAEQVVDAPLYSRYFKKTSEYRVIWSNELGLIYAASKRKPEGVEMDRDELLIRNLDSGYVYQVEQQRDLPVAVIEVCHEVGISLSMSGLELMAYDVVFNSETRNAAVIEANSAPGLNEESAALVSDALNKLEKLYE